MGGHGFGGGGKWFRNEGKEIWFGVVVFDKTRKGKRNGESRSTRFSECAPLMSGCCTWNGQFHESVEMISSQHEIKNKIYYLANFIHFYSTFFPLHEYRPKMDIDDLLYDSLMYIYIFFSTRDFDQSELRRRYDKTWCSRVVRDRGIRSNWLSLTTRKSLKSLNTENRQKDPSNFHFYAAGFKCCLITCHKHVARMKNIHGQN